MSKVATNDIGRTVEHAVYNLEVHLLESNIENTANTGILEWYWLFIDCIVEEMIFHR